MQAYALQVYLQSIGCDVETLDRRPSESRLAKMKMLTVNLLRLFLGRIKSLPTKRKHNFVFKKLVQFRDRNIKLSTQIVSEEQIRCYYRSKNFDIVLVGSDQVWRPKYSPSIFNYYLDFLDDGRESPIRMSYAASFGVDDWEYNDSATRTSKRLIEKFDAISVREESAVELCESYLGVSGVKCVVDPTFLLSTDDYLELIGAASANEEYAAILMYILNIDEEKKVVVDRVANLLGMNTFSIKPERRIEEVSADMLMSCQYPGVEQWLQSFRDAAFVLTDSFHGCVFAIIFNKHFIALNNPGRGTTRILSLLRMFGLENRLVATVEEIDSQLVSGPIDWGHVNSVRQLKSEEGKAFLKSGFGMGSGHG
jgi:hypothetical protein